ncbi:PA2778 family cysteine peptidase [Pseudohalioglobus sediminis]|uniref:PA2778 family cysteine peptidase n=1 Tax=Pseudohalioglobus sediminis TaxID=2606449 RepID=UPI00165F044A|nr:PA2778 family cysteine peptidase [Pseudohalioglobus sediminis]
MIFSTKARPGSGGRSIAAIFLVPFFLFISACSAPQTRDLLSQKQANVPQKQLLQVPFFPQEQYQCGPAALAGLLKFHGVETNPEELQPLVYLPDRQGSLQVEMKAGLRRYGLIALPLTAVNGEAMSRLIAALDENYPVLVLQNLGIDLAPQWHYAVVTGYDLGSGEIILNSGTQPNLRLNMSRFEHTWRRSGYWALLASTPDRIPKLADPLGWNSAALESEQTGQLLVAFTAYQAALQRWPDNELALLGSGNTAYSLHRYGPAAESFYRLAISNGDQAATGWNNLAYALMSLQCLPEARLAAAKALALQPDSVSIMHTVEEVGRWSANPGPGPVAHCEPWRLRLAD